jgi:D-3-phosphoglycerate dehydrogenase
LGKVLITARSVAASKEAAAILESAGHEIVVHTGSRTLSEEEMLRVIPGMDAAIVGLDSVTAKVLAAGAPRLKIIARNGVGYSNVDLKAAAAAGVVVTLTPGVNAVSVAELAIGLMLALARHIPRQDADVHKGAWSRAMGRELHGKVLGVIGTGHIGAEVIKRAQAFGMKTVAVDVQPRPELCQKYGVNYVSREEVFRLADFLSLHVPSTPETDGLVNSRTLRLMKPAACIINTARGELINEPDLCAALKSGLIAGFAADTLIQEPPPASHPLLSLANVVLTPHCGAYTNEAVGRSSTFAAQEVVRVLRGERPLYPIGKMVTRAGAEACRCR